AETTPPRWWRACVVQATDSAEDRAAIIERVGAAYHSNPESISREVVAFYGSPTPPTPIRAGSRVVEGNILEANVQALVNPVNTVGVMGKGLALQFKQTFPAMFNAYRIACEAGWVKIGQVYVHDRGATAKPRYILNFPTKRHWKDPSSLEDIEAGLIALADELKTLGITSVAIPALGCGLGGLPWGVVLLMIERLIGTIPGVETLIYGPSPNAGPEPAPKPTTPLATGRKVQTSMFD
ncbi:macro domain-containing protein, partial [Singulisphaera rosea]